MKKLFIILFIFLSQYGYSQEIWDKETSTYINHELGFHWNLISGVDWIKLPTNNQNTNFKAVSDIGITVMVSANNIGIDSNGYDACDFIEDLKKNMDTILKQRDAITGSKSEIKYAICSNFLGKNAIKIIIKCSLSDDIHNESYYEISYNFLKDKMLFGVTAQIMEEVYYYLGEDDIKSIFYGFGFNAK